MFSSKNARLIALGIGLLVIGYVLLGQGPVNNPLSRSLAPLILVLAYCVLLPYAIIARGKDTDDKK